MTERPMPDRRETQRQKVKIAGQRIYLDVGLYEDGTVGEVFIVCEKTGAGRRWMFDEVARLASKLIQYGCPVEQIAEGWLGTKGDPCGPVRTPADARWTRDGAGLSSVRRPRGTGGSPHG